MLLLLIIMLLLSTYGIYLAGSVLFSQTQHDIETLKDRLYTSCLVLVCFVLFGIVYLVELLNVNL